VPSQATDKQLTPHFTLSEFRCPCCGDVIERAAAQLAHRLEPVRAVFGPVIITSAYRCPRHNATVKGSASSQHLTGLAADIACATNSDRFLLVVTLIGAGFTRIGIGAKAVHADIGTPTGPVMWTYY
jgi:uncharacterized protein YcbK (DUF882 family)